MAVTDSITKARQRAELAEMRARAGKAEAECRLTSLRLRSIRQAERATRGGGRGAMMMSGEPVSPGSGGKGGYRSDRYPRTRSAGGRGRGGSAASFLSPSTRHRIRVDSQQLCRRNPLARALTERSADLTVSHGFSVQAASDDKEWNKAVETWITAWARCVGADAADGKGADYAREKTLAAFTHAVEVSLHEDGDIGVVLTDEGSLQAIESERIINPHGRGDTEKIIGGIELDANGRPLKYHVADWAPLGTFVRQSSTYAVDAQHFALLVNPKRPRFNQWRGEPTLAAVIERFENLDDTSEAVRLSYYVAACQAMLYSTEQPGIEQGLAPGETVTRGDGTVERHEYAEPGQIRRLPPNATAVQFKPEQPSTHYDILRMAEITDIAADAGLPVVLLLLDFSKVNYSSARNAVISAFRTIRRRQQYLIDAFLCRVYRWRVAMAIRRGEIPGYPPGYTPDNWDRHEWAAPPPPVLDPMVEMETAERAIKARLKSRKRIMSETWGIDYDAEIERIQVEEEDLKARGVSMVQDPGAADPNAEQDANAEGAEEAEVEGEEGDEAGVEAEDMRGGE